MTGALRSTFVAALAGFFALVSLGCVSIAEGEVERARSEFLEFLVPGETTRREAILRLGEPSGSFEDGSVLTWRVSVVGDEDDDSVHMSTCGVVTPAPGTVPVWREPAFSLVLAFDGDGRLREFSLVPVVR